MLQTRVQNEMQRNAPSDGKRRRSDMQLGVADELTALESPRKGKETMSALGHASCLRKQDDGFKTSAE